MTDPTRLLRLPGGRLAAETPGGWVRTAAAAAELLGPAAWRATRSARRHPDCAAAVAAGWGRRAARRLGIQFHVSGTEHVDPNARYVVAPLHEGFADVLALLGFPLPLAFAGRSELAEWRPLRAWTAVTEMLLVDPERPVAGYRTLLREGTRRLEAGQSVVVFPQGTILGIECAFHPGAFRLAARAGVPVLPVVLAGGHRVWEHPFSPLVRFGQPMYVEILPPIDPAVAVAAVPEVAADMRQRALAQQVAPVRRFDPDRDGWWDGYAYEIDPAFPALAARVDAHRRSIGSAS